MAAMTDPQADECTMTDSEADYETDSELIE
jgi:hypothetical protein